MTCMGIYSAFNEIAQRPHPLLVEVAISPDPCASSEIHHLIPQRLWDSDPFLSNNRQIEAMMGSRHAPNNLMALPSTEEGARISNLALHNGSHYGYSDEVIRRLEDIKRSSQAIPAGTERDSQIVSDLYELQNDLRKSLDRSLGGEQLMLSSKDPNFHLASPQHQATVRDLQGSVDAIRDNPRLAYPSNKSVNNACMQEVTVESLAATAVRLREEAWSNAPEDQRPADMGAGILARDALQNISDSLNASNAEAAPAPAATGAAPPQTTLEIIADNPGTVMAGAAAAAAIVLSRGRAAPFAATPAAAAALLFMRPPDMDPPAANDPQMDTSTSPASPRRAPAQAGAGF